MCSVTSGLKLVQESFFYFLLRKTHDEKTERKRVFQEKVTTDLFM